MRLPNHQHDVKIEQGVSGRVMLVVLRESDVPSLRLIASRHVVGNSFPFVLQPIPGQQTLSFVTHAICRKLVYCRLLQDVSFYSSSPHILKSPRAL